MCPHLVILLENIKSVDQVKLNALKVEIKQYFWLLKSVPLLLLMHLIPSPYLRGIVWTKIVRNSVMGMNKANDK